MQSEGIAIAVACGGELIETERFSWPTWDRAPVTHERVKASLQPLVTALHALPPIP